MRTIALLVGGFCFGAATVHLGSYLTVNHPSYPSWYHLVAVGVILGFGLLVVFLGVRVKGGELK